MNTVEKVKTPQRVLVIRIGRLGDTILATPIIQVLRQVLGPGVLIDFAVSPGVCSAILEFDQRINRVFPVTRRKLPWYLNRSKYALRKHSQSQRYDLVFNLESGRQCDDFIEFVQTAEFHGRPLSGTILLPGRHCVDSEKRVYADVLGREATAAAFPSLQLRHETGVLPKGIEGDYIVLNPGFSGMRRKGYRRHRCWPNSHWIKLIDLLGRSGFNVVINGSAVEKRYFQPLLDQPGVRSLFGCPVAELIAAMVGSHGLISVDTGSMHLGSALGIPVLALFGPTDPGLTGPYCGNAMSRVLTSGIDCQPCVRTARQKRCGFNRCMQALSPETVFAEFENMLWQIPKPSKAPRSDQPSNLCASPRPVNHWFPGL